jgi:hypothetical protein
MTLEHLHIKRTRTYCGLCFRTHNRSSARSRCPATDRATGMPFPLCPCEEAPRRFLCHWAKPGAKITNETFRVWLPTYREQLPNHVEYGKRKLQLDS